MKITEIQQARNYLRSWGGIIALTLKNKIAEAAKAKQVDELNLETLEAAIQNYKEIKEAMEKFGLDLHGDTKPPKPEPVDQVLTMDT